MAVNVNDKIQRLSAAQRRKVEDRAGELIAEKMTLRELWRARKLTQVRMAKALGITRDSVSRLRKAQRSAAVHTPEDAQGDGWEPVAGRGIPGSGAGCIVRHRRR